MYKYLIGIGSFIANLFRTKNKRNWIEVKSKVRTHWDIENELKNGGYEYTRTKDTYFDNIQRPDIFVASRRGDCDDFANFSFELLNYLQYQVYLVGIWEGCNKGHAITVFYFNNTWNFFSNQNCYCSFNSFGEAVKRFYGDKTTRWEIIKEGDNKYVDNSFAG